MVYDAARARTVLFGGSDFGRATLFDDTWEWDGAVWTRQPTTVRPAPRDGGLMAYDTRRRIVHLIGGSDRGLVAFRDHWTWDGSRWQQQAALPVSLTGNRGAVAYDDGRDRLVLFQSFDGSGPTANTWEWDGARWLQRAPAQRPPVGQRGVMAYDSARARTVWVAPTPQPSTEVWEWDGANWSQRITATRSPLFLVPAVTYDSRRARVVMLTQGGYPEPAPDVLWFLGAAPRASVRGFGNSCGSAGVPAPRLSTHGLPWIGRASFGLELLDAPASAPAALLHSSGMGATPFLGCTLLVDLTRVVALPNGTSAAGLATWPIPIPDRLGLSGTSAFWQGLTIQNGSLQATSGLQTRF